VITREQVPSVLDHMVHDAEGKKIGKAAHVFLDDRTGEPEWASVRTGLFGTHESFVPIHDANLVEDHLEVPYTKSKIGDAPHVDVDSGGHLSATEERELYDFYGVDWGAPEPGPAGTAGTAGAAGTGAAGARGRTGQERGTERARMDRERRGQAADAMTRSEEQMRVGTERHETGRARLRKYVVTEDVEQTVPVRHEEVRVEHEPITDANREQATRGPAISEDEYEVTLHEERPVSRTEAVPVERVRMVPEEYTEEQTVRGKVRKERIEEDVPQEEDPRKRDR
jgi:uncharacterized protein (TIGR02271 family)